MNKMKGYLEKDRSEGQSDLLSFLFLFKFIIPYWWQYSLSIFAMSVGGWCLTRASRQMGYLVENGLSVTNKEVAYYHAFLVLLFVTTSIFLMWGGQRALVYFASKSILRIRRHMFIQMQALPISYYDHVPRGRTITRITSDVEGIETFFIQTMSTFINYGISFLVATVSLMFIKPLYGLFVAMLFLPAILLPIVTRKKIRIVNSDVSRHRSSGNSLLAESMSGIETIRAFGLETFSYKKFMGALTKQRDCLLVSNLFYSWFNAFGAFLCSLPVIVHLGLGGYLFSVRELSLGSFVTYFGLISQLSLPIMIFMREVQNLQQAFISLERVGQFLKAPTEEETLGKDGGLSMDQGSGSVTFQNVTMAYDEERTILKDLSFAITPGEKVGIVGTTGSGKTTTLSLLVRLYDYQQGEILIDGTSLRNYKRDALRRGIGFVTQDVQILKGTLRENLLCGEELADDLLYTKIEETGLTILMNRNGLTLDSHILENGENLSAGERQLIALARVIIKNPKILIMDEATSNIDGHHEELVHHAIFNLLKDKTCFIIAHRLDTLKMCDKILVFNDGKIVESGNRSQLLEQKGVFHQLYEKNKIDDLRC